MVDVVFTFESMVNRIAEMEIDLMYQLFQCSVDRCHAKWLAVWIHFNITRLATSWISSWLTSKMWKLCGRLLMKVNLLEFVLIKLSQLNSIALFFKNKA